MIVLTRLYLLLIALLFFMVLHSAFFSNQKIGIIKKRKFHNKFYFFAIALAILVAFRPIEVVSDAMGYYNRYYIEPEYTTLSDILHASSFYRGSGYSMSKPVNFLFYIFYKLYVPYELFIVLIILAELFIYFWFARKICLEFNIRQNEYVLLLSVLVFYSFKYQFVAFAQSMAMCFAMPILYYMMKKSYFKMLMFLMIACLFHVSAFFFIPIVFIFIFTPKMKNRTYAVVWGLVGILQFSGLGFRLGDYVAWAADFVIKKITSNNPIYNIYSAGDGTFVISLTSILIWIIYGVIVMSCNNRDEYWKILNVNLLSMLMNSIFGRWTVVHRFTDISMSFMPIVILIYFYESKIKYRIGDTNAKTKVLMPLMFLGFVSGMRVLGLL